MEIPQSQLEQKNVYNVPFLTNEHQEFVLWFFTGDKCNLECSHCYVESGPKADRHPYLSYEKFKSYLDEAVDKNYNKLDIYFTGGEPFMNPNIIEMIRDSMKQANTTILTNATKITEEYATKLKEIQEKSDFKLNFRTSLDGPNSKMNDLIRGPKAFERAERGIDRLIKNGFNPIVTSMRSWTLLDDGRVRDDYVELLVNKGIPPEKQNLKILPPLRFGREAARNRSYSNDEMFTEACFTDYDFNNLQCSKCRMVSERGVWVCPILINDDDARMGDTITEAAKPYAMKQMACWTCRMEGMSCTND